MSRLERVLRAWNRVQVVGLEALTSVAHLIAVLPKLVSALMLLIAEIDKLEEIAELLNEIVEKFLERLKDKARDKKLEY